MDTDKRPLRRAVTITYPECDGRVWRFRQEPRVPGLQPLGDRDALGHGSLHGALVTRENHASSLRHRGYAVELEGAPDGR